jgi:hypothetical protein
MTTFQQGSRGPEVTRIEIRLRELGLYTGSVDDAFGAGVAAGVRSFQQRSGLAVTGAVDDATWTALFSEPSPRLGAVAGKPLAYRCLALTAGFETGAGVPDCFTGLAGNFDGQGLSFGVLQWNLGQGTLQPLLKQLDAAHPEVVATAFGDGYGALKSVLAMRAGEGVAWAKSIQDGANHVSQAWRERFKALGRTPECQDAQVRGAQDRYERGLALCKEYGLWSERAAALMFDVVVQNGSINAATKAKIQGDFAAIPAGASAADAEVLRMRAVANRRAEAANPRFTEDVRSRKLTCANGAGVVHGAGYDLEREYGIRLAAAEGAAAAQATAAAGSAPVLSPLPDIAPVADAATAPAPDVRMSPGV